MRLGVGGVVYVVRLAYDAALQESLSQRFAVAMGGSYLYWRRQDGHQR